MLKGEGVGGPVLTQQRADLVVREPDEAPPPFHRTRRSILDNEAAWRLAEDALERMVDDVVEHRIPYGDIAELRLSYDPTRFETNRYRCDIRTASGVRALIVSVSYVSLANFDDRSKTYLPFVRALTERVARANPGCRFRAGRPLFRYLAGKPSCFWCCFCSSRCFM
jgi:hypothetical protein